MIWWRGKGLVMGLIVAILVVGGGGAHLGKYGVAIGLVAAAVASFALKEWAGEESSLYSIPVRFWPWGLVVLAALAFISPGA